MSAMEKCLFQSNLSPTLILRCFSKTSFHQAMTFFVAHTQLFFRLYYLFQGQRTAQIKEETLVKTLMWLSPIISATVISLDAAENAIFYRGNPLMFGFRDLQRSL